MSHVSKLTRALQNFHDDEAGIEALQAVMIIAIAAVCLIVIKNYWGDIKKFFEENVTGALGKTGDTWDSAKSAGSGS